MIKNLFIQLLIFCSFGQFSSVVKALDLMGAYEIALGGDPVYRSATKEYEAGLEYENIGRSALFPRVLANYNAATNKATQWGQQYPGGPNISYDWRYPSNFAAAQLTQPIISLDAFAKWKQGVAQTEVSNAKYIYSTQDLLVRVSQAYVDLLFAMDQLQYLKIENEAFKQQAITSTFLFENGEGLKTDSLEAKAAQLMSEAKVIDARDMVENARRKLNAILGNTLGANESVNSLKDKFPFLAIESGSFKDWEEKAIASNAELVGMKAQVEVALQEYRKNIAGHYPVVNFIAAITTQNSNTVSSINQTTNQNYVGVQVNLPIFSGGEIVSKSNQAYANYEKSKADFAVAQDRIVTELRKQYDLVHSGQAKIRALVGAKESSEQLVQSMKKSVVSGERINLDILLAQKALFLANRDLAQTKYSYLVAFLKLHQLSGTLEVNDFQKVAQYFKKS
ncbi:TolC family outer membrane protein [Polynucleobacter sinensis]|uniref:TolC family outer membrane protein n=1 Tax=Polynucleobacter sinensis TaxID=1743157 RepID=UPI000784177B|nr:TolC family outer membrane protein [Polynucleobacter sinensis]